MRSCYRNCAPANPKLISGLNRHRPPGRCRTCSLWSGMRALFGWAGVDQYDETTPVGQDVINRFEARFGYRPANFFTLVCYDAANVVAHAISGAHPLSPAGVRAGMYGVRMLPAACGGPRTLISFAPFNHRAWLGSDYLVVRKVVADRDISPLDDLGTELVHRMTPRTRSDRRG